MKTLANIYILTLVGLFICSCDRSEIFQLPSEVEENLILTGTENGKDIPGKYIIMFNNKDFKGVEDLTYEERILLVRESSSRFLKENNVSEKNIDQVFSSVLEGISVRLSQQEANEIANSENGVTLIADKLIVLKRPGIVSTSIENSIIPKGIVRIGYAPCTEKKVWLIDTGVDFSHPDLNVDIKNSKTFVRTKLANDDNGHGTHCAGIIAAKNNDIGVVGVASGAEIVALKVLDRKGNGTLSSLLAGIDYACGKANDGDVVVINVSITKNEAIDNAILKASKKISFVFAAGNESSNVANYSPININDENIWTVSAMNENDQWAFYSNYGSETVDFCMPGTNVLSTFKNGEYAILSGTSMAAAHLAGVLLLCDGKPKISGFVNGDPDAVTDPVAKF